MRKNRKKIFDIKTGNVIIMHVVKNQLRHAHKSNKDDMTTKVLILPLTSFGMIEFGTTDDCSRQRSVRE